MKTTYCGLTKEQFERFSQACWQTYHAIAPDIGDGGRSRKDQIEFICDADYIRMHGQPSYGRGGKERNPNIQPFNEFYDEVIGPMIHKNYGKPAFMKMMKEVFPHSRYE